jgi:hypothetical protein
MGSSAPPAPLNEKPPARRLNALSTNSITLITNPVPFSHHSPRITHATPHPTSRRPYWQASGAWEFAAVAAHAAAARPRQAAWEASGERRAKSCFFFS